MALNGTMVKIETVTVGSGGAAYIEFLNIPSTYTDLKIVLSARHSSSTSAGTISLNGSTTGFTYRTLYGTGSSAISNTNALGYFANDNTYTASTFGNTEIYIPNYTSSNNKSISVDTVTENNATAAEAGMFAVLWSNTAAITSLRLTPNSSNTFLQHSTATLYGISRTTSQIKATGGMVYDTADYVYHLFNASGTFTPTQNLTVDYLVVAGGGAGGSAAASGYIAGGGGAGGYLSSSTSLTASTNYTVTVGAGGTAGAAGNNVGTSGSDSVFGSITATGGGRGGSGAGGNTAPLTGGSGGGAGGTSPNITGANGTTGQGNRGGNGNVSGYGGGGGGSGGAGTDAGVGGSITAAGTAGGVGTSNSITGSSVTYAAGGKTSSSDNDGAGGNGAANTGNGGGGAQTATSAGQAARAGGAGGSGVVIVRYAK